MISAVVGGGLRHYGLEKPQDLLDGKPQHLGNYETGENDRVSKAMDIGGRLKDFVVPVRVSMITGEIIDGRLRCQAAVGVIEYLLVEYVHSATLS